MDAAVSTALSTGGLHTQSKLYWLREFFIIFTFAVVTSPGLAMSIGDLSPPPEWITSWYGQKLMQ